MTDSSLDRYEPVVVVSRYERPPSPIDPDPELGWMRRLFPLVKARRGLFTIAVLTGVVALVSQVAVPAVLRLGIDAATDGRKLRNYVIALVILAVVRVVFGALYRFGLFKAAYHVETDMRNLLYEKLTSLQFTFYDRTQSGQVISRANSDVRAIQLLLSFGPLVLMSGLTFVLAFGFMLRISVPLTLVALCPMPFVYWFGIRLRRQVFPLSWVVQARMADMATVVDENLNGIRVVQSYAAEEGQLLDLARKATSLKWASVATANSRARWNPLIEALPRVGSAIVLLYGGVLAIDGKVSIGTLVAFNAYVIMMQTPFRMAGFLLIQQQRASASAQRIFEILDEEPTIGDRPDAIELRDPIGRIELNDVRFGYRDYPVLEHLSLRIEAGETVAIVGRTGSGKSTIARLLPRFYDVDSGSVMIDGVDVRDYSVASLRHHIGLVLDEPFLFSVSLADNIAYGRPAASRDDIIDAARSAQAHDFITALPHGYDTVVGERGYTLSGGQRQRIAIARTLLVNPKILVLDDATSAIDVATEVAIHHALESRLEGRTTIVIAHRLSTIALADRVLLVEGGHIMADGTHQHLLATVPLYGEVLARVRDESEDSDPAVRA
jgi:ATP-binding cassette subfamily B protein